MAKCRIMVLKRSLNPDLIDEYIESKYKERGFGLCPILEDGQVFLTESAARMPEGFCGWAWADIQRDITAVLFGSHLPWMKQRGLSIACCTDGARPVIFKVERID